MWLAAGIFFGVRGLIGLLCQTWDDLFFRSNLLEPGWTHAQIGNATPHKRLHNIVYYRLFSTLNGWWTRYLQTTVRDIRYAPDAETGFPRFDSVKLLPRWFRVLHTLIQNRKKFVFGGLGMLVFFLRSYFIQLTGINLWDDALEEVALTDEELCLCFLNGNFGGLLRPLGTHPDLVCQAEAFRTSSPDGVDLKFHVFDYRSYYDEETPVDLRGGDQLRNPCLVRALFADNGTNLHLVCIADDLTRLVYDCNSLAKQWLRAKNRLHSKALWIAQVYMHLGNHLRPGSYRRMITGYSGCFVRTVDTLLHEISSTRVQFEFPTNSWNSCPEVRCCHIKRYTFGIKSTTTKFGGGRILSSTRSL